MGLVDFLFNLFAAKPADSGGAARNAGTARAEPQSRRSSGREPFAADQAHGSFSALMGQLQLRHARVRRVMHSPHAYHTFQIAKRDGQAREIHAPCKSLKHIQRRILRRLVEPHDRHEAVHGFRRRRGIASNAAPHVGREMVLSLDLANFFPTVSAKRVYGLWRALKWPQNLASMLTRLVTWQGVLPQGAPSSPALANLVARRLDCRLAGLARHRGLNYTRYADDLTFSGQAAPVRAAFPLIARIVEEEGFHLNKKKVRFMRRGRRQTVTGLVVNDQVSAPRDYRRTVRATLHAIATGKRTFATPAERAKALGELHGHVQFIRSIRPEQAKPLEESLAALTA
jgi:retron-type reverse transcriptase